MPSSSIDTVNISKYNSPNLSNNRKSNTNHYALILLGSPDNSVLNGSITYTDDLGCALIKDISFKFNGTPIETLTGTWIDLRNKLFLSDEQQATIKKQQSGFIESERSYESYVSVSGHVRSNNNNYDGEDMTNVLPKKNGGQVSMLQYKLIFHFGLQKICNRLYQLI